MPSLPGGCAPTSSWCEAGSNVLVKLRHATGTRGKGLSRADLIGHPGFKTAPAGSIVAGSREADFRDTKERSPGTA
jgi:hypothetical protein